jgi:phosphatidylglycerophosphate synthase
MQLHYTSAFIVSLLMRISRQTIPYLLIYGRLIAGFIVLAISIFPVRNYTLFAGALFSAGLLSDIFDGIIARRLNISTTGMRRLDSLVDQVFWLCIIGGLFFRYPAFAERNLFKILLLAAVELLAYAVSYLRFGKEVATHAISSKLWTLVLFATLLELLFTGNSTILFEICFYSGLATRLEIVCILLLLRQWTNDVPSVYHAMQLRKGKPVKRHKLLNG